MKHLFSRHLHSIFLAGIVLAIMLTSHASVFAQTSAKNYPGRKISPPPSADLTYTITANQKGLALDGTAIAQWRASATQYSVTTETRAAMLGKILETKSEGSIDRSGLAPDVATEKRFRKDRTTTSFNRQNKTITFSASDASYPIKGGEQDRNSAVWQLVTLARTGTFKTGSTIPLFVAGPKDADAWTFKAIKQQKIGTALGQLNTLHVSKVVKDGKGQKIDIWLAPAKEWYPVRIRVTEPKGDFIEQTIEKITPKS